MGQEFYIIVVEPKYQGNIGAIARVMANFGQKKLVLVNPCPVEAEAFFRAMHAQDILENAEVYPDLKSAIKDLDVVIGTSGILNKNDRHHLRNPVSSMDLKKLIAGVEGKIGIVFGREDRGLDTDELAMMDFLVYIPANPEYPSLNLSHAVAVILYEIWGIDCSYQSFEPASAEHKEKLFRMFDAYLEAMEFAEHKKKRISLVFQRVIGRAMISRHEFSVLMGVFSRGIRKIRESRVRDAGQNQMITNNGIVDCQNVDENDDEEEDYGTDTLYDGEESQNKQE
ncbi:MAG: RNA methyltransferase [Thermoplasmata archaeon]